MTDGRPVARTGTDAAPARAAEDTVRRLVAEEDEATLARSLADTSTALAARAVALAPTLERKTALLWAMEDRQRREVLEQLPAALVAALVQNLEEENRYLLGDLSVEQFRAILALCSPERQYAWVMTALSFTDARANALPLLLTTRELAEILMTRAEFEAHVRALGDYPIEHERLPPDLLVDPAQALVDLFGAEGLLRQFPVADAGLARFLQTLLELDPDRYVDLIREALRLADYAENHPLEWEALTEDPILLEAIERPEPTAGAEPAELPGAAATELPVETPLALVPVDAPRLARLAAALPARARERVEQELQHLAIRQAVAEGGSFHRADLARVARSVEAYLLLGLQAESGGDPEREAAILASRPLHRIAHSGARVVERLRQVALRLGPMERILDLEQQAVVRSLSRPRMTLGPEGEPRIQLLPAGALPESIAPGEAAARLQAIAAWAALARALGLERTARALERADSTAALLDELALGAVLFGRIEYGLAEPGDRARFAARYVSPEGEPAPEAREGVRRALEPLGARGLDLPLVLPLFEAALRRLAREAVGAA